MDEHTVVKLVTVGDLNYIRKAVKQGIINDPLEVVDWVEKTGIVKELK